MEKQRRTTKNLTPHSLSAIDLQHLHKNPSRTSIIVQIIAPYYVDFLIAPHNKIAITKGKSKI